MRVLHLLKTSVGASWALRQVAQLVKRNVEVHVALPDGPLVKQYVQAGATVHCVEVNCDQRCPWLWPSAIACYRALLRDVAPNLVHSHFVGTTITMRLGGYNTNIPRVFQVPGPLHLENSITRKFEIGIAGTLDYWIASCEWTRECYRRSGIAENRLFLAYYGPNFSEMIPQKSDWLRPSLGVQREALLVGMVAYMYAPKWFLGQRVGIKGHEDFIEAFSKCLESDDNMHAVIAGGAWGGGTQYENKIREMGREKCGNNIHFLGTRNDIPDIYADLDMVVHPSHSENVGGAFESLYSGVPTIATCVGGFPDVIKHEKTGLLVKPQQPDEIAAAIMRYRKNPSWAKALAAEGRKLVMAVADTGTNACRVIEAYKSILEQASHENGMK